jgi:DhnA family fructose-bisphosphate aldolase class Ia
MTGTIGQQLRMRDIIQDDNKCIIGELTDGLFGIEFQNIKPALEKMIKSQVDAIILSPGMARKHSAFLLKKNAPGLIIRADWSNSKMDNTTAYPRQEHRHVSICSATEALRIGAAAILTDAFFGTTDEKSVEDLQRVRELAEEGLDIGIPTIVNIIPYGERVNVNNYADVALLGARMTLEIGATAACVPLLEPEIIKQILDSTLKSPIFLNTSIKSKFNQPINLKETIDKYFELGISGILVNAFNSEVSVDDFISDIHK